MKINTNKQGSQWGEKSNARDRSIVGSQYGDYQNSQRVGKQKKKKNNEK
jgi:hypothetical protein